MDQSEEAAFTIVENWWKKSFDISKNTDDPLFSLYTKSFETIMVYMTQSLDYEYIEREISSLDNDRQLALQSENGYDAHRCLSFGLIEAVQMMMKKNTKKLEQMIKQGFINVPEIPKFPLEPKEEEILDDPEPIPAENEISSQSLPKDLSEQPIDDFTQEFLAGDQTSPLASIEQDFHLKEEEMVDNDVNSGMGDFALEIDNTLNKSLLEDDNMDEPDGPLSEENDLVSKKKSSDNKEIMNDEPPLNQIMKEGRKSTRKISRPVKNNSMEDSDEEEEIEPIMQKSRLDEAEKSLEVSSQVKCVLCEVHPKTVRDYVNHLYRRHKDKCTLNANGIYLICSCGKEIHSRADEYRTHLECDGLQFNLHLTEDKVHSTPQCILCETHPKTAYGYATHLRDVHKSTLNANGIYLICSCVFEVHSEKGGLNHSKKCDRSNFSLHKINDKDYSTPQCIMCETYPKTAYGYTNHLMKMHKSTLNANGIYLLCSCGFEVRSEAGGLKHSKKCDERQFSLHKNTHE